MAHVLAQVRLRRTTNLPEDVCINTFHFRTPAELITAGEQTAITDKLIAFYNVVPPGHSNSIQSRMSNLLAPTQHQVRLYNMGAPVPRAPIMETSFDFAQPLSSSSVMPAEVSLVISFRAALVSGTLPRRRRGRIYIGPLGPSITTADGDVRPVQQMIDEFVASAAALRNAAGPVWSVFSDVSNMLSDVAVVSVDNAFDTQRRRGAKATNRKTG